MLFSTKISSSFSVLGSEEVDQLDRSTGLEREKF